MSVQRTAAALRQTRHVFSTQNNEVLAQDVLFWEKRSWLWTARCAVSFLLQESPTEVDGVVLLEARQDKERTHPELIGTGRCMLVVVAIESGGSLE